jgi:hypothetical protein
MKAQTTTLCDIEQIGTCPLCGEDNKRLVTSHYMPSAAYCPESENGNTWRAMARARTAMK